VKRLPANVVKYGTQLSPILSNIPIVGGVLGGLTGVLGGLGGGSEVLSVDPSYAPGGTPLGQGGLGGVNPGQEFGGRPVAQSSNLVRHPSGRKLYTEPTKVNPLFLVGGGLLLLMMLRR
tara:strand:+ start:5561 stop:5917 length:357 start_codon:yes stop_codon:yes gene_type:complete